MKNKVLLIVACCLLCGTGFIAADYAGLFGITEKPEYVLQKVRIRPFDSRNNAPIEGVRVRCFQRGHQNVCSQRDSGKPGIVSVIVPGIKMNRSSLLFDKGYRYLGSKDPKIQIMLIHVDYLSKVESIEVAGLLSLSAEVYKVKMEPRETTRNDWKPDNI